MLKNTMIPQNQVLLRVVNGSEKRRHETATMFRSLRGFAAICIGLILVGCGQRGPAVNFVEGVVTFDGVALSGADIGFSPVVPGEGLSAVGSTREDGTFRLNAVGARPGRGTMAGEYVVTVRKFESKESEASVTFEERDRSSQPPVLSQPDLKNPPFRSVVPKVYGSQETTPLRATVSAGKNSFQFDLTSDATPAK